MTSAAQDDNAVKRLNVLRGYFPTMKVGGITIFLCLEPPTNNRVIDDYMYIHSLTFIAAIKSKACQKIVLFRSSFQMFQRSGANVTCFLYRLHNETLGKKINSTHDCLDYHM